MKPLQWLAKAEPILLPTGAMLLAMLLFAGFVWANGQSPAEVFGLLWMGGFSDSFAWQNTLLRAAPLILTGLAVAIPARAGLVIIGGEGALALGALAAGMAGVYLGVFPPIIVQSGMLIAGALLGAVWIGFAGWLRHWRGVNETISSLLLFYIGVAIFNHCVEGPLRDPASLNKPSTPPIAEINWIQSIPGLDVHWGLVVGLVVAIVLGIILRWTTLGFALRVVGGNVRAARLVGLPVGAMVVGASAVGGAAAGLAGAIEVAAVHGSANASVLAGYGHNGILVAFLARHNPFAVIPVAILIGGVNAAGGLLQRRLDMPDATVLVLQGITFVIVLAADSLSGKLPGWANRQLGARTTVKLGSV